MKEPKDNLCLWNICDKYLCCSNKFIEGFSKLNVQSTQFKSWVYFPAGNSLKKEVPNRLYKV